MKENEQTDLEFLDEVTKEKVKKKMEEYKKKIYLNSGIPRDDGTIYILFIDTEGKIIDKIKGKAQNWAIEKEIGIDVPTEIKQKIYEKKYFETKEIAKHQSPYEEKYNHYKAWVHGLKGAFPNLERVLDIGCGRGEFVRAFNKIKIDAYGVDVSKYSINEGLTKAPYLKEKLIVCDIDKERLPFTDNYFDLVITINTIEHITFPGRCVDEAKRVLKPGGYILVVTHIPESKYDLSDETHLNVRSKKEWIRLIEKHGLLRNESREQEIISKMIKSKPPSTEEGHQQDPKKREEKVRRVLLENIMTLIFQKPPVQDEIHM